MTVSVRKTKFLESTLGTGLAIGLLSLVLVDAQQPPIICPPVAVIDGERTHQVLGFSLGTIGDLNADGLSDFFVGSAGPLIAEGPLGEVCVYSGADRSVIHCWQGDQAYAGFGGAVPAGDVNGDGAPDLLVSAAAYHGPAGWQAGRVYLLSGTNDEPIWVWDADTEYQYFGAALAGPGDVDGDGVPDIVIGEPGFNEAMIEFPGEVHLYSGATGELIYTLTGDAPADHFGTAVSSAGDWDQDGRPDILVGAPWNDGGKVYVFSGLTAENLWFSDGASLGVCPSNGSPITATVSG